MAKRTKAFSSFSVNDLDKAKNFYSEILGMKVREYSREGCGTMLFLMLDDETEVLIYLKKDHAPASFTVLNIPVENVEEAVRKLTAKGVSFEHYEGSDEQGIMHDAGPVISWFKDPAGNFLSIVEADEIAEDFEDSSANRKYYEYAEEFLF
jgi:predicted enzyme related to lactoylglutathione lyase